MASHVFLQCSHECSDTLQAAHSPRVIPDPRAARTAAKLWSLGDFEGERAATREAAGRQLKEAIRAGLL